MPCNSSTARKLCNFPHGPTNCPAATGRGTENPFARAHTSRTHSCNPGDHARPGNNVANIPRKRDN